MQITPATKVVGLIGHPVAHSLSPVLHNHLYQSLGLDMVYHAFDVLPDQVEAAAAGLKALGFTGFNVTVPHKEVVYNLLDWIDEEAEIVGAVNTVKIENGRLEGYNTDGQGFIQSLHASGFSVSNKKVVMLGAGGAARAIGISVSKEEPEEICIINRTFSRADRLAYLINNHKGRIIARAASVIPANTDFIINTTCLGMWPDTVGNPIQGYSLSSHMVVCDIVYNPRQTAMLKYAEKHGCRVCDGMGMLIGQGIKAVEIWLDTSLSKDSWQLMSKAAYNHK